MCTGTFINTEMLLLRGQPDIPVVVSQVMTLQKAAFAPLNVGTCLQASM